MGGSRLGFWVLGLWEWLRGWRGCVGDILSLRGVPGRISINRLVAGVECASVKRKRCAMS